MAKQTFYFLEVTWPQEIVDAYPGVDGWEIARKHLWEYIGNTDSKYAKAVESFVYDEVRQYPWQGNKAAVRVRFMNERHFDQYMNMVSEYRTWLTDTYGVEFSHEVHAHFELSVDDTPYKADDETTIAPTSYEDRFVQMFDDIAESRGFDVS